MKKNGRFLSLMIASFLSLGSLSGAQMTDTNELVRQERERLQDSVTKMQNILALEGFKHSVSNGKEVALEEKEALAQLVLYKLQEANGFFGRAEEKERILNSIKNRLKKQEKNLQYNTYMSRGALGALGIIVLLEALRENSFIGSTLRKIKKGITHLVVGKNRSVL